MTDYKTVFQLAQDKGYDISPFHSYLNLALSEVKQELIVLTLIQKWLRDEHHLHVELEFRSSAGIYFFEVIKTNTYTKHSPHYKGGNILYQHREYKNGLSYEAALLEGINEALKLLK